MGICYIFARRVILDEVIHAQEIDAVSKLALEWLDSKFNSLTQPIVKPYLVEDKSWNKTQMWLYYRIPIHLNENVKNSFC